MPTLPKGWICAQLGAREHYALPRALQRSNRLRHLITDYWAGDLTKSIARITGHPSMMSLAGRVHPGIPTAAVTSLNARFLLWELSGRFRGGDALSRYAGYCRTGQLFASAVVSQLNQCKTIPPNGAFLGYDTTSLETMKFLKGEGFPCIVSQTDPCRVEINMVQHEERMWPGWSTAELMVPEEFFERRQAEWELADKLIANSEFCRSALIEQGVNPDKIEVIPLSYEPHDNFEPSRSRADHKAVSFSFSRPLRVLFLGQVMLRKGIQYLLAAAEKMRGLPITFDVVGPLYISSRAVAGAPENVRFHGRVARSEIDRWFSIADVFILPTLSDGFAITQIEAMAHGLPVIATRNCGDVVTTEVDGLIIEARDSTAIHRALTRYLDDPLLHLEQRAHALKKAQRFSLERLCEDLMLLETKISTQRGPQS